MSKTTGIAWCDSTFNPWIGCSKISPACDNCYAERDWQDRRHVVTWGAGQERKRTSAANWKLPLRWNAKTFYECETCGWRGEDGTQSDRLRLCMNCHTGTRLMPARRRVFCASLADVFDNEIEPAWRLDLFNLILSTPNLDWLLLTKRIGNVRDMLGTISHASDSDLSLLDIMPLPNVWLGITVCNQTEADRDIPKLLAVPAAVRFLSVEPMLGSVALGRALANALHLVRDGNTIDWVICGGESGSKARPIHPDWVRSLRDQCTAAGVPFLFKQWGEHDLSYDRDRDDPDYRRCAQIARQPGRWINLAGGHGFNGERVHYAHKVGKKAAGRLLDGREHNEFPEAQA